MTYLQTAFHLATPQASSPSKNVAMPPQKSSSTFKLSKLPLAAALFVLNANWAAAATSTPTAGSGSLDDWLALGLAMLAALYCVQKRE